MPAECTGTSGGKSNHGHTRSSLSLSKIESHGDTKGVFFFDAQAGVKLAEAATKPALTTTMPTPSSFTTQPVHGDYSPDIWATVVFDFVASSPFEISVDGENFVGRPWYRD
jgi:hypothetical protein